MVSALLGNRLIVRLFVILILLATPLYATAQTTLVTPPDQLALNVDEGNGYYIDPEFPIQETYSVQDGVIDPERTGMSETVRNTFEEAGVIDQFLRSTYVTPDYINSPMYPNGPSSIILQVRVLTFPSNEQAAQYVNHAYAEKVEELRDSQSTESATDLNEVPWNDEAVSGYSIPSVATDTATGLNIEYLVVNYAGQQDSMVIMARVIAPPDLAEPIAREMFYAQMACVQVDAPCGSFMVPAVDLSLTAEIESLNGGGSISTSVGESGADTSASESASSPAADSSVPETATSGRLSAFDLQLESSGNWVLQPRSAMNNNIIEGMPLRGTNDNVIIAWVANVEGADRVSTVLSFLAPDIGTPILIEDGGTYMLHVVEVNGVTYGIFSTLEVSSTALDSIVHIYIAPLSTFGAGMTDAQASVMVNGSPVFPNVDGAALVPAFGGIVGDPATEAALPPLIGG